MADMHFLESPGGAYSVTCHFPIPATNNRVNTPWRTAYVRHVTIETGLAPMTRLPSGDGTQGTITVTEATDVTNGLLAERARTFTPPTDWADRTPAQRNAMLDSWYAAEKAAFDAWRRDYLDEFGRTR